VKADLYTFLCFSFIDCLLFLSEIHLSLSLWVCLFLYLTIFATFCPYTFLCAVHNSSELCCSVFRLASAENDFITVTSHSSFFGPVCALKSPIALDHDVAKLRVLPSSDCRKLLIFSCSICRCIDLYDGDLCIMAIQNHGQDPVTDWLPFK